VPWWECCNHLGIEHEHKTCGLATFTFAESEFSKLGKEKKKAFSSPFPVTALDSDPRP